MAAELPPRHEISDSISHALTQIDSPVLWDRTLGGGPQHPEHWETAVRVLSTAKEELARQSADPISLGGFIDTDSLELSLVLSRIAEVNRPEVRVLADLPGVSKYELLDPGWWASLFNRVAHKRVPWISHQKLDDFRVDVNREMLSIAMVGDWGTGLPTSTRIASAMKGKKPDVTVHLGDVYYSGLESEVNSNFLPNWPAGTFASFAVNSNHEMYSGGEGYFRVTLKDKAFQPHQKASYFCLSMPAWQLIGLDSAYAAPDFLYHHGGLADSQVEWLEYQLALGAKNNQRSIILTHHNPLSASATGGVDKGLLDRLTQAGSQNPFHFWYWAHEHVGARFALFGAPSRQFLGRCVGHGGIPYAPEKVGNVAGGASVEWTETEKPGNQDPEPRRGKNGFVFLELTPGPKGLRETFIDEFGVVKEHGAY